MISKIYRARLISHMAFTVFDFENEIGMDLTHVTASVGWSAILKARTLRHLSWPNETEDVVWVRSFLLLDGLPAKDKEPHLPEPDIPQVTRSLKQT